MKFFILDSNFFSVPPFLSHFKRETDEEHRRLGFFYFYNTSFKLADKGGFGSRSDLATEMLI